MAVSSGFLCYFPAMKRFFQSLYQRHAAYAMFSTWSPTYEEDVSACKYSAADEVATVSIRLLAAMERDTPAIADIGIGTGLLAQQIYDAMPCEIAGIDFTDDMLAICQQREIARMLIKCDAGKDHWPLEDNSYDGVVSAGLLEYFTTSMVQHFIHESARILNKGGILVFTYIPTDEPREQISFWEGKSGRFLSCRYNPAEMMRILNEAKLDIIEHSDEFTGSVFRDGSTYPYRLIAAKKA